ncbi:MAG: hypothetical protein PUC45_07915 [Oscillospiraceae bacterium]|nr:hypothetical protein [Oscillospiraceae bacterium]
MKKILAGRQGVTLVELVVSLALMCLTLTMVSGALRPAAAVVRHMERLAEAQVILDTTLDVLRSEIETACGYVKLCGGEGRPGTVTAGTVLEYLDVEGRLVRISTEGWEEALPDGGQPGRLVFLRQDGETSDWSCREPFGKGFYMGMYLGMEFSPVEEAAEGETAEAILVTVTLYQDGERRERAGAESLIVDLRCGPLWIADEG